MVKTWALLCDGFNRGFDFFICEFSAPLYDASYAQQ